MQADLNEDGFSTFRTGKHIDQMTMEEVEQIEKHIQNKISNLLSMEDFDPENSNHKLQMSELKADRDRIRERKSSFSVDTPSATTGSTIEGPSQSGESTVEQARRAQQEAINKQMNDFVPRNGSGHALDEGVIEGEFTEVSKDNPATAQQKPTQDLSPAVVEQPPKGAPTGPGETLPSVIEEPKAQSSRTGNTSRGAGGRLELPGPGSPPTPSEVAKKSKLLSGRNLLGGAFVGYDAYSRIQDGENAAVAIAKAVGTNALFAALPGGIVGGLAIGGGVMLASMATDLYDASEAKKAELSGKTNVFQTSFEESEGQIANRQQGMQQQQQAEQYALDRMRRHAQGSHSTY